MQKLLRFYLFVAAILTLSSGVSAKPVTAVQALQRVTVGSTIKTRSMKAETTNLELAHTFTASATAEEPMVYVFNRGAEHGYVIAPADDLFPAVLGYSDSGSFDIDRVPPAMKAFIESYAREIEYNLEHNADKIASTALFDPGWEAIEPLMTTQWNQNAPYNDQCPKVGNTSTYTGCVATSMAQVMKYHEWPDVGEGSNSYTWNGQTLSVNFSDIQFDWANMNDIYSSGNYTSAAAQAVAELMYACGVSVNMNYGTNASGASTRNQTIALAKYFKYSKAIRYLDRDVVSSTEFEKIIYDNLAEGLPVLYDGGSSSGAHSFVCDGYAGKHYFHFNWGWGGSSDGYFYLARLNPSDQGIGSSDGGYNSGQGINYNIRPVRDGNDTGEPETYVPNIVCDGNFTLRYNYSNGSTSFAAINPASGDEGAFWNWTLYEFNGTLGVIVRDSENNERYFSGLNANGLPVGNGYRYISPVITGLNPGNYTVHPAFKESSSSQPTLMKVSNGCKSFVKMTVSANGTNTFPAMTAEDYKAPLPDMMVNCFNYSGDVLKNESHNFLISVSNLSSETDYYGSMTLVIKDDNGDEVDTHSLGYYDVPASLTIPTSISLTLSLDPAFYTVSVRDDRGRELPGEFPLEITGEGTPLTTQLRVVSLSPTEITPNSSTDVSIQVKNFGSSAISAQKFGLYYKAVNSLDNYTGWAFSYPSALSFTAGGTRNLVVGGVPFKLSAGDYNIIITWFNSNGSEITISPEYLMRVGYPIESVAINEQDNQLEKDEELQLTATLKPAYATYRTLSWSSSNSNVVTVDNDGNIKAVSPGTAYISATAHNGSLDHTQVVVKGNSSIKDISADELKTVNAVYTISGVKILANPTEAQILDLAPSLYIFQTPKRAFTVKK